MIELMQRVSIIANGLTAGELFTVKDDDPAQIAYFEGNYPDKGTPEGTPPLCAVLLGKFNPGPGGNSVVIKLYFLLYNETTAGAMEDLDRLAGLLKPMTMKGVDYGSWNLNSAEGFPGDPDHWVHADPQYSLTYLLEFSRTRKFK